MEENALNGLEKALQEEQARITATAQRLSEQLAKVHEVLGEFTRDLDAQRDNAENFGKPLSEHVEAIRSEMAEAQGGNAVSQEELLSLSSAVLDWEERFNALQKEHGEGQAAVKASKDRISALEQDLEDARKALSTSENELANLNAVLDEKKEVASEMKSESQSLLEQLSAQEEQIASLESKNADLTSDLEDAGKEKASQEATLENARNQLRHNEEELEQLREALTTAESKAQEQEAAAQASVQQQEEQSQQAIDQMADDLNTAQAQIQELEAALKESQAKEADPALEEELLNARRETGMARDELRTANQTLDQLKSLLGGSAGLQEAAPSPLPAPVAAPEAINESTRDIMARIKEVCATLEKKGKPPLGQLLVEADALSEEDLDEAFQAQKAQPNKHLGALLVEKGLVDEVVLAQALAAQSQMELVQLDSIAIDADVPGLISDRLARQHHCIPIAATAQEITIAIANPLDLVAIEDVERATNRRTNIVVAPPKSITWALQQYYATTTA